MVVLTLFLHLPLWAQTFRWVDDTSSKNFGSVGIAKPLSTNTNWADQFYLKTPAKGPKMAGKYHLSRDSLFFIPAFPPDPDMRYQALLIVENDTFTSSHQFQIKKRKPVEVNLWPAAGQLPANHLRFYLSFNQPMGFANPYDFLRLTVNNHVVQEPWVEIAEHLWNRDRTRLTLLVHPGRIKRGVSPLATLGAVFKTGDQVELIVSEGWSTLSGSTLENQKNHYYTITPAIREPLKGMTIAASPVPLNSLEPLRLQVDRLLDPFLIQRYTVVLDRQGEIIAGNWTLDGDGLSFIPEVAWTQQPWKWKIHPNMEDLSGNRLHHAFEWEGGITSGREMAFHLF